MMYDEFCNMVRDLKPELAYPEYEDFCNMIEPVYMWHPADISKEDAAEIYCMSGGLRIFKSLLSDAIKVMDIHDKMDRVREKYDKELEILQDQLDDAMEGKLS